MKCSAQAGFTLLEVLVALIIIAIGLLGIAGMQALAINSTGTARTHGLAAIQAASLAAAMQSNEGFWTAGTAPALTTVNGTVLGNATLNGQNVDCTQNVCTAVQLAADDLKKWGVALQVLPNGQGSVACTTVVNTTVTCTISVTWNEMTVGLNQGTAAAAATQTYSMVVQP
ncbi:MAG: type IV pilus modification protein PilV [Thiobacillaceae bacterium]